MPYLICVYKVGRNRFFADPLPILSPDHVIYGRSLRSFVWWQGRGELLITNVPRNYGRCLFNKITNRNAKNVWILIPRPGPSQRGQWLARHGAGLLCCSVGNQASTGPLSYALPAVSTLALPRPDSLSRHFMCRTVGLFWDLNNKTRF